jgi:hypothetical protein
MSKPTCINLKERFGKQYRVVCEDSYYAQYGPRARTVDSWLMVMPCRHGHIFPHGGDLLAASTDKAGGVARRLKALAGVTVHQDGDDGATVLFPVEMFNQVAALMKPRRRRVVNLTEEQRAELRERLRRAREGWQSVPQGLLAVATAGCETTVENCQL